MKTIYKVFNHTFFFKGNSEKTVAVVENKK